LIGSQNGRHNIDVSGVHRLALLLLPVWVVGTRTFPINDRFKKPNIDRVVSAFLIL